MPSRDKKKVMFVCLGNMCRSPMAEALLRHTLKKTGDDVCWHIESAAIIDFHKGKIPDKRARAIMEKYDIPMKNIAKQIKQKDFNEFDYILAMDDMNISDLKSMAPPTYRAKIELLGSYGQQADLYIEDPYFNDGSNGFDECYHHILRCVVEFLQQVPS